MNNMHSLSPKNTMIFQKLKLGINQKQKFHLPLIQNSMTKRNSSIYKPEKHLSIRKGNLNESFIFNNPILPKILNSSLFEEKSKNNKFEKKEYNKNIKKNKKTASIYLFSNFKENTILSDKYNKLINPLKRKQLNQTGNNPYISVKNIGDYSPLKSIEISKLDELYNTYNNIKFETPINYHRPLIKIKERQTSIDPFLVKDKIRKIRNTINTISHPSSRSKKFNKDKCFHPIQFTPNKEGLNGHADTSRNISISQLYPNIYLNIYLNSKKSIHKRRKLNSQEVLKNQLFKLNRIFDNERKAKNDLEKILKNLKSD